MEVKGNYEYKKAIIIDSDNILFFTINNNYVM